MVQECWDRDPDARLTAANVYYQMIDLCDLSPQQQQQQQQQQDDLSVSHAPSSSHSLGVGPDHTPNNNNHTPNNNHNARRARLSLEVRNVVPIFCQEHSQSTPPPCYSPTDPFSNQEPNLGMRPVRNFQSSMPHIMQGGGAERGWREGGGVSVADVVTLTPRCTRSLRSSVVPQYGGGGGGGGGWGQPHPSHSVRNSLVLGDDDHHAHAPPTTTDDPLPTFADACLDSMTTASSSSHSIPIGMGMRLVEGSHSVPGMRLGQATRGSDGSSEMEVILPTDSGIQIPRSNTSQSTLQSEDRETPPHSGR